MSVLKNYYDSEKSFASPVLVDNVLVKNYDEDGNEIISFVPCDYPSIVRSNGSVSDWSLNNLLKAGIDPDFGIHTSNSTRIEGLDQVNAGVAAINSVLDSVNDSNSE